MQPTNPLTQWLARESVQMNLGWTGSLLAHSTVAFTLIILTMLNALPFIQPRAAGEQSVVSLDVVMETQVAEEQELLKPVEFEIASVEPVPLPTPVEPMKIEVQPEQVQMAERVYVMVASDLPPMTPSESEAQRTQRESTTPSHKPHEDARPPMPKQQTLAMVTPPAVPLPQSVGTETPARMRSSNTPPIYPLAAVNARQQGRVVLRATISPAGTVSKLEVASSSGHSVLDAAAYTAVRTWTFEPGYRGGQPVESVLRIPIRFRLP